MLQKKRSSNGQLGVWYMDVYGGLSSSPTAGTRFFPQIDCSDVYFQLINQLYHPHRSMGYSPQIAIWIGEMMIIHWIWGWLPNFQTKPHGFSQFLKAAPSCRKPLRSLGVPTALCSPNTHTSRSQRICHRIQPCSNDPDAWLDWLDLQRPLGILCHVFHRNISNLGQFSHPPKVDKLETWKALVNMCHLPQLSASPRGVSESVAVPFPSENQRNPRQRWKLRHGHFQCSSTSESLVWKGNFLANHSFFFWVLAFLGTLS